MSILLWLTSTVKTHSFRLLCAQAAFTQRSRSELGLDELERQLAAARVVDTDRRIIDCHNDCHAAL